MDGRAFSGLSTRGGKLWQETLRRALRRWHLASVGRPRRQTGTKGSKGRLRFHPNWKGKPSPDGKTDRHPLHDPPRPPAGRLCFDHHAQNKLRERAASRDPGKRKDCQSLHPEPPLHHLRLGPEGESADQNNRHHLPTPWQIHHHLRQSGRGGRDV